MKNAEPTSAVPHTISRRAHGGQLCIASGSMHVTLKTSAPMK
jgi:hypothetical protein